MYKNCFIEVDKKLLKKAIKIKGSQTKLAKYLTRECKLLETIPNTIFGDEDFNIPNQYVNNWLHRNDHMPYIVHIVLEKLIKEEMK